MTQEFTTTAGEARTAASSRGRSALAGLFLLIGCQDGDAAGSRGATTPLDAGPLDSGQFAQDSAAASTDTPATNPDARSPAMVRDDLPELCTHERDDAVRDIFCSDPHARIAGLRELQQQLRLFLTPEDSSPNTLRGLVLLGHSTSLSGRLVSPINPRALLLGTETALAFQRGVQAVELASIDRQRRALNFYLVEFEQACNARATGCTPGDLYTSRIESDWTRVHIRDDEQLANTQFDCRQCHQRGRQSPMLLMRELVGPWSHFFAEEPTLPPEAQDAGVFDASAADRESGVDLEPDSYAAAIGGELVAAYRRAKGQEDYAHIPGAIIGQTAGLLLQRIVPRDQPLEFDSPTIRGESANADPSLPAVKRRSPTWDRAFEGFKRGENLALPHFANDPTDPGKLARLSDAYRRYRAKQLPAEQLPDLADVFPDDPQVRAEIGLTTEANATPAQALIQACGACHNDVLDQTISRARFNIDLARMDRRERELAIERIQRAPAVAGVMPPPNARQLTLDVREQMIAYLRQDQRSAEDDALLVRAARLGMQGNAGPGTP